MMQNSNKQFKKDVIWNAISSTTNGMINMIISFFVINLLGSDTGGIFGFGFSTLGQQVFILSYFGIRIFQVIDVSYRYDFDTYRNHRLITFISSILFLIAYLLIYFRLGIYDRDKCFILFLICIFKAIEGIFDVFECELQRNHKLYLACQFNFARVALSTSVLLGFLYLLRNSNIQGALIALCIFIIFQVIFGTIFINTKKEYFKSSTSSIFSPENKAKILALTKEVLPIFLATFLDFWIFSLSKYALDIYSTNYTVGLFSILFMPATLMSLIINFFLRPYLSTLADYEKNSDREGFKDVSFKMYAIAFAIAILGIGSVLVIGKPVLSIIDMLTGFKYNQTIVDMVPLLVIIILGGFAYTLVNIRYNILAVKNKQKPMLYCYMIMLVIGIVLSWQLTSRFDMYGAASSFAATMFILFALLCMVK